MRQLFPQHWIIRQILFWLGMTLGTASVLGLPFSSGYDLRVGDVVPQDIRSPLDMTYQSEIHAAELQAEAAAAVPLVYTSPDPQIARRQLDRLRQVLAYVGALRADTYATDTQKYAWLLAVPELARISQSNASAILLFPEANWNRVQLESLRLLDQVMRQDSIREDNVLDTQQRLPALIPFDLAQDEAAVVSEMAKSFVRPNVFYDAPATEIERQRAREQAPPAFRTFRSGEIIVREGDLVTDLVMEALHKLGLSAQRRSWLDVGSIVLLSGTLVLSFGIYLWQIQPTLLLVAQQELLLFILMQVFLLLARMLLPASGDLLPYLFPGAALAMLVSICIGKQAAVGASVFLGCVCGWIAGRSWNFATLVAASGVIAALTLPRYGLTGSIFRAGLLAGIVSAILYFSYSAQRLGADSLAVLINFSVCVIGGLVSGGLTVGGLFLLTPLFDLTTSFRLVELSSPNHPLMQRLLREAPATFNHVMMVTSLAEQAAERIGANALLTRVGAYYHDVGKLVRPYFFIENQQGVKNPHDRLDPYTSVDIVIGHVRDGLRLAREYHLPARVRAFISEHHGTMRASFFYQKAVSAAGDEAGLVDESQFRYPGPAPQSRETLLVMLADSCEAAARAQRPLTPEALERLVNSIFEQRMREGQMDACPITMRELHIVKETYIELLRGAFHPRVKYPEPKPIEEHGDEKTA